jgi:hypothetical protein
MWFAANERKEIGLAQSRCRHSTCAPGTSDIHSRFRPPTLGDDHPAVGIIQAQGSQYPRCCSGGTAAQITITGE